MGGPLAPARQWRVRRVRAGPTHLRAVSANTEQADDPPPPPYKCKLVSVLGKKENKSLINVCCVVNDFVTTSVANGLCTRNNGLLAEREIA